MQRKSIQLDHQRKQHTKEKVKTKECNHRDEEKRERKKTYSLTTEERSTQKYPVKTKECNHENKQNENNT